MAEVWRGSAAAFVLSVLLIGWTPAQVDGQGSASGSARYTFTTLVDSQRDGLEPLRCAAINTVGTVAVVVDDVLADVEKIITKRSATDIPVVIADEGDGTPDSPTFCDHGFSNLSFNDVSINELGGVAFQGNLRRVNDPTGRPDCATVQQRDTPRQGVFLGRGGPLTTIAHTDNEPGGGFISEFLVADQSVNTLGRAAGIVPELDGTGDQGLYVALEKRDVQSTLPRRRTDAGRLQFQQHLVPRVDERSRADRVRERHQRDGHRGDLPFESEWHLQDDCR